MDNCCNNCYSICDTIASCFDQFLIYTPLTYAEETIQVNITNGQRITVTGEYDATLGYIDLDLSEFPEGFFSAYGGPYLLEFFNPVTGAKISLPTKDGLTYFCIQFGINNQTGNNETAFINAFSSEVPEAYGS